MGLLPRGDSAVERVIKVVLDLAALFIAANLAYDLRYYVDWGGWFKPGPAPWGALYQALPYMLLSWFVIFSTFGLYRAHLRRRQEFALVLKASATVFVILFSTAFFYRGFSYSRIAAMFMVPIAFLLTITFRLFFRAMQIQLLRLNTVRERLLIIGCSDETPKLINRLCRPNNPYDLVGILSKTRFDLPDGVSFLGDLENLPAVLSQYDVDRVLLISGAMDHDELMAAIDTCLAKRVPWAVVPDLYDLLLDRLHMDEVVGIPVMGPRGSNIVGMNRAIKRLIDFMLAAVLLILLAPLMLGIALLVKLTSKGPVLFIQDRIGRGNRRFRLYKFRSMFVDAQRNQAQQAMTQVINGGCAQVRKGKPLYKLPNDPRVTPLGGFLRRFSLDELPQLFNVLRGEMSLIGPRPAIPHEVNQYRHRHRRRLEAQPGITGLWQVSGRNRLSFEEMIELDIQYIENWSAGLDIRIFFKTIAAVLFSRGY